MSKFHEKPIERHIDSIKTQKLIMPDVLAKELNVAQTKFFEYRFMSALAATKHFAELYSEKAKAYARTHQDIVTAEKVRGMAYNLFSKPSASLTEFWNARLKADSMGIPYGLLIDFGFHFASRRKWHRTPRPGQLFGSENSSAIWPEMFKAYHAEHFNLFIRKISDVPQYRHENYKGLQSQNDFVKFILEEITSSTQPWDRLIVRYCIEHRYLPVTSALYRVPKDMRKTVIERVRSDIRDQQIPSKPFETLPTVSFVPSCYSIPSAHNPVAPQCANCPFIKDCASDCQTLGERMIERYGSKKQLSGSRESFATAYQ